eukprot:scaffold434612_cov13-Prasinocladus_malaysianus.AAC.1
MSDISFANTWVIRLTCVQQSTVGKGKYFFQLDDSYSKDWLAFGHSCYIYNSPIKRVATQCHDISLQQ